MTLDDRQLTSATSILTTERQTFGCLNKTKKSRLGPWIIEDPNKNLELEFPQNEIGVFTSRRLCLTLL